MAIPVWPASLSQRMEAQGYQEGQGDGRLRSSMDGGPGKVRQRFRPARPVSGTILMTAAQLATFRAFVDGDLAGGSLPFQFPAQSASGVWLVRFADSMPTWSTYGVPGAWRVSLSLEILP
ncbi:hypothetical protein GCM10011390_41610 [Aureimonas endophytica]|uniref:Uncharacterized protein n=1 Tax=Aureimonas endophytica TaxID=2027858 RepID=A0A916ZZH4_9HYPH|nr:hypothetical protein GCM10011390_41610 [Aureimonas endophytica]